MTVFIIDLFMHCVVVDNIKLESRYISVNIGLQVIQTSCFNFLKF